ncbi:MAG: hypothetical protein WC738_06090 [Candidatus Omnitrophota bacterium]|jgi:hypothetical protein
MKFRFLVFLIAGCFLAAALQGCGVTYPKGQFKESVIKLCKKEYNLDVKAETVGKTIAIYVPIKDLLDFNFSITKKAAEQINNVILSVSRAAISTDAAFEFYCIIAHDAKIPELQIIIIKSVEDVKRFMLNDISRGEYSKRMLVDLRLSPQAQKERAIKEVFEKMSLDKKWQEDVMNDFFRSEPTALSDIGYWNEKFYIKDVGLGEFLAEQVANRVKIGFRENKETNEKFLIKASKGTYETKNSKHYFRFEFLNEPKWIKDFQKEEISNTIFKEAVSAASDVIGGYHFNDYEYIEIASQYDGKSLKVSKPDLEGFRKKKIKFEDILTGS